MLGPEWTPFPEPVDEQGMTLDEVHEWVLKVEEKIARDSLSHRIWNPTNQEMDNLLTIPQEDLDIAA